MSDSTARSDSSTNGADRLASDGTRFQLEITASGSSDDRVTVCTESTTEGLKTLDRLTDIFTAAGYDFVGAKVIPITCLVSGVELTVKISITPHHRTPEGYAAVDVEHVTTHHLINMIDRLLSKHCPQAKKPTQDGATPTSTTPVDPIARLTDPTWLAQTVGEALEEIRKDPLGAIIKGLRGDL